LQKSFDYIKKKSGFTKNKIFSIKEQVASSLIVCSWIRGLILKTKEEAETLSPLYLDMIFDAKILYDKDSFFNAVLNDLKLKLEHLKAKRLKVGRSINAAIVHLLRDASEEGKRWLEQAKADLKWARDLAERGGYHIACFLFVF